MKHTTGLVGLLYLLLGACGGSQFKVAIEASRVTVDCQLLGEYPSSVRHILLSRRTGGEVVWEARAISGTPQVHRISVSIGKNAVEVPNVTAGRLESLVPRQGDFVLLPGVEYNLAIWGEDETRKAAEVNFTLH